MSLSFILGLVGNITTGLVCLAPVPTFWHIVKKRSTEEFESIPYIFQLVNGCFWTYYGIVKPNSIVVATVNGFSVALMTIYVVIFLVFAPLKMKVRTIVLAVTFDIVFPLVAISLSVLILDREMQISTAGLLSAIFSMIAYGSPLSAMKTVIITKSVEYMPFTLSFLLSVNGGVWTVYSILTKDIYIGIPNVTGLGLGIFQLLLYAMYWKPKKVSSIDGNGIAVGAGDLEDGIAVHEPLLLPNSPATPKQENIDEQ
ncbi:bidirectional sugar transporter SWEET17-like [Punica granatum]|uniref:Bidirectional sugar transporter SWEET n=1 Tax=Punica granatum TaxID=22663 RepID=A0A6P8C2L2_PUNGR|nr:bidirectional sugar transporter SWEET17-like [Punica granatum]